ncbi:MAG: hypothetical protein QGG64_03880, partial [Candidatus Latescibacteria bacterium]|nr:hypothetical protein [Candidatus Latescibacterota bacterium]
MNNTRKTKAQLIHELTVQNALERVRSRALGMQTSNELAGVATTFFGEFQSLGLEPLITAVNVIDQDAETVQLFITGIESKTLFNRTEEDLQAKPGTIQTFDEIREMHIDLDRILQSWERGDAYCLIQSEKRDIIQFVNRGRHFQSLSPEQKEQLIDSIPEISYSHNIFYSHGWLSIACAESRPEEDLAVAKRFVEVFDFAYARFLELKEKEDQNRELTVQNALERVRSRALGMQTSEELAGVSMALFDEFENLGFEIFYVGVNIIDRETETFQQFTRAPSFQAIIERTEEELHARPALKLTFEHLRKLYPGFDRAIKTWKKGEPYYRFPSEEHEETIQNWSSVSIVQSLLPEQRSRFFETLPERLFKHAIFFSQGWVVISSPDPLTEEDLATSKRFVDVFDFAYGRFLELKAKEDQNRELTVQNALERVRSRALGMQTSEELAGVSTALFNEFENLEFELIFVSVNVID